MASLICKLGAPIGPRLMHSPGPFQGPSFYAHGAASAFCSSRARPFNRVKDRQDATLLILDGRLLPPNNRLPFTPVPQPICLACPTAFFSFVADGTPPRTFEERCRERERTFWRSTLNVSQMAHPLRRMYTQTHYFVHSHALVHRQCTWRGAVCTPRYIGRPTPCLSRPHRPTRFRGLAGGVLRQQVARLSRIDVRRPRFPLGSSLRACA